MKYSVELMTVDAVVSRLGITARTLHYYEEVGLLPYVGRTEGGHRIYSEETVLRLEKILRLKETLGYPLKEIRKILEAEESLDKLREEYRRTADGSGERTLVLTQFEELLQSLIERIDSRLVRLQNMRDAYNARLEKTRGILRELREQGEEPS